MVPATVAKLRHAFAMGRMGTAATPLEPFSMELGSIMGKTKVLLMASVVRLLPRLGPLWAPSSEASALLRL